MLKKIPINRKKLVFEEKSSNPAFLDESNIKE
jgi:hypothetical protein